MLKDEEFKQMSEALDSKVKHLKKIADGLLKKSALKEQTD